MPTMTVNLVFHINRTDEQVCVSVHDLDGQPVEFFRLHSGHPALAWTDERVKAYLTNKLAGTA